MIERNQYLTAWLVCDICAARFTIKSKNADDTITAAFDTGWVEFGDSYLCPSCRDEQNQLNNLYNGITGDMIK